MISGKFHLLFVKKFRETEGCPKGHNEGDLVKIGQELKDPRAVKVLEFQGLACLME